VTLKEVSSVIDDINAWERTPGSFIYYVTAIFTDESVGSVGRKDHDAALEVQGLLREAIGIEQDFTLESKGQTKTGRDKFNIKGFRTPGGAATYTAPGIIQGVQGDGVRLASKDALSASRPPEPSSEQASIRASVAIKAAVELGGDINTVFENADAINAWLVEKTSEPALGAYHTAVVDNPQSPQAGAGSETTSGGSDRGGTPPSNVDAAEAVPTLTPGPSSDSARASEPTFVGAESESGGGVESKGKEPAPPPINQEDYTVLADGTSHQHDWQAHPNLHGWLSCECGENRKKYAP